MTLSEIRNECWDLAREVGSSEADRLWTVREMNRYINRTCRTITRETKCLRDAVSTAVCLVPVTVIDYTTLVAGTLDYLRANDPASWLYQQNVAPIALPLDPRIIAIDEVKWVVRPWKLTKVSVAKWQVNPQWEQVSGIPTEYATDYSNNTIALNCRATESDTLQLTVRRLPLVNLVADGDIPEIRTQYHDFFINGVMALMYSKQDTEIVDGKKASEYQAAFLKDLDEIKQQETLLGQKLNVNFSMGAFR